MGKALFDCTLILNYFLKPPKLIQLIQRHGPNPLSYVIDDDDYDEGRFLLISQIIL